MAGFDSPEIAFAYIDGHLYYGSNHIEIMTKLGYLTDDFNTLHELHGPSAWGWIWNEGGTQTAEFYSDFYENEAKDPAFFEEIFNLLKQHFPNLTELTFGPQKELLDEIKNELSTHEMEGWDLPTPSHYKVSFRWSRENGLEIV